MEEGDVEYVDRREATRALKEAQGEEETDWMVEGEGEEGAEENDGSKSTSDGDSDDEA